MKKVMTVLAFFLMAGIAQASSQITLKWDAVDFASCGSDPNLSGYKLYKSTDDGTTKQLFGTVNSIILTYVYTEPVSAKYCYFVTAFNQVGESLYSDPACAYVSNTKPPIPSGLDAVVKVLQEISDTLKGILQGITG